MKGRQVIKTMLLLLVLVILSSFSYAACSCIMEETPVLFDDNAIFTCSCSSGTEISQSYNVTWYNADSEVISLHMGTTPGTVNTQFSTVHKVIDFTESVTAILTGPNLEGEDTALVLPANADGPKLPITIGFGFIALILFFIGYSMVKNQNKGLRVEIALAGVQVISGAFVVLWGLLWLLMTFALGQIYYEVVKVFFTIYSIILGFFPLLVCVVSGLIVTFLFLGRFFKK